MMPLLVPWPSPLGPFYPSAWESSLETLCVCSAPLSGRSEPNILCADILTKFITSQGPLALGSLLACHCFLTQPQTGLGSL